MSKEMIVSVNGREKKIAILDNGKVTEFYIERGEENSGIAGNIYKGRVQRVLPGMQSAFVGIGLERDAFLYVSDFFDEEEEIERIVMEKSRKTSPEEAKREANEQIERARATREKQMESVQEIAEPLALPSDDATEPDEAAGGKGRKGKSRGRKERETSSKDEVLSGAFVSDFKVEIEDSGFERIVDDAETGELFKDAFRQEAIVDQVRAIEFDFESTGAAEVGSLLADGFESEASAFERIADEEEDAPAEAKPTRGRTKKAAAEKKTTRGRSKKAEADIAEQPDAEPIEAKPKAKAKTRSTKSKTKKKAEGEGEVLEDGEASVKAAPDTAEMSVRRGGRGRRRGGRARRSDDPFAVIEAVDAVDERDQNTAANGAEADALNVAAGNGNLPDAGESGDEVLRSEAEAAEPSGVEPRETKRSDGRREGWEPRDRRGRDSRDRGRGQSDRGRQDKRDRGPQPTISDLLREGQEILVQIAKEPIAKKGARITSHIALPGRFLVYMPTIEHLGVSRKIESSSERGRLRNLIQRIRQEEDIPSGGFIVRTAGIGISEEDLRQDARYLVRTWQDIKKTSERAKSPALVHQDLDIVQRLLRDQMSDEFTAIRVDSEEEFLRTVEFMNRIQPRMVNRVKLYTRDEPILDHYGVQEEIDKALKPRVWLKSGGYLVINQTEALVAIDVNTGKFVGKGNARLEDTITKTNLEAVEEIARQIRLRDLGGIIVLDLIDMEDRRNRHKVSQALQEALQNDKSPTKVLSFNDFGLIIMTRKRVKQSLERTLCTVCEYCEGSGWVKSPQTVCFEILAESARLSKQLDDVKQSTLRVHPDVAKALRSSEREVLDEIEAHLGPVDITADPHIHQAQYDFAFV